MGIGATLRTLGLVGVLTVLATGCGGQVTQGGPSAAPTNAAASTAAPTSAAPKALTKVTVGISGLNASHLWAVAARDEKLMAPAGVDLELVSFPGVANITAALLSNSVNFGVLSTNGAMAAEAKAPNLKLVVGTVVGNATSLVVAPDIKTWADLKGKKISANAPGTSSDYFTMVPMLAKNGLVENRDYTFVLGGATATRVAALTAGAVSAVLLQSPDTFRLQGMGFRILSTPADESIQGDYLSIALAANKDWYNAPATHDAAVSFVRGYQDTLKWLFDPANRAKASADFAKEFNVPVELAQKTYDAYFQGPNAYNAKLDKTGAIDLKTLEVTLKLGKDQGDALIKSFESKDLPGFFDNSLAEAAKARK